MKKLIKSVLIIIVAILIAAGCSKQSNIKEISFEDFKEKIANKESFPLYVGNAGCSHCISYRPVLESIANEYDIVIYHLDNSKLTDEEYSEFKKYINISGTPTVAFITDGEEETTLNRITGEASKDATISRFKTNGYIK